MMGIHKTRQNKNASKLEARGADRKSRSGFADPIGKKQESKVLAGRLAPFNDSFEKASSKVEPHVVSTSVLTSTREKSNQFSPRKAIREQPDKLKERLLVRFQQAKFDQSPLVVASNADLLLVGLHEIKEFHQKKWESLRKYPTAERIAWQNGFKNFSITFFENSDKPPMFLKSLAAAGRLGVSSTDLIVCLLLPAFSREASQVLRAFLVEKKVLTVSNQIAKKDILNALDEKDKKRGMEELLFSALLSHTTELTRFLLEEGVSPDVYSDDLKFHPLEWCSIFGANKQAKLLLEFGADPNNAQIKKRPNAMSKELVAQTIGSLASD